MLGKTHGRGEVVMTMEAMNVDGLIKMLQAFKKQKTIDGKDVIWLSSDPEGNSFGRLAQESRWSLGVAKGKVILYPIDTECAEDVLDDPE